MSSAINVSKRTKSRLNVRRGPPYGICGSVAPEPRRVTTSFMV